MVTLLAYGSPPHMRGMPARTAFFCSSIGSPPAYAGKKRPAPGRKPVAAEHPAHAGNCPVLRNPGRNAAPRITPARAGKRRPSHVYSQPFWDHPCLCREKICYEAPEDEKNGSPPRMRGKAVHKGLYRPALRITPACAGKSSIVPSSVLRRRDHPRLCGEKVGLTGTPAPNGGSPPPVRGKDHLHSRLAQAGGITPAYAGKSSARSRRRASSTDHPRLCGEKSKFGTCTFNVIGSPPPVRGKALRAEQQAGKGGITPACAGKRLPIRRAKRRRRDHPRLCGEKCAGLAHPGLQEGSPPPVRGKGRGRRGGQRGLGITPACAGKSLPLSHMRSVAEDHPRVCGEKLHRCRRSSRPEGSPPRVRGKGPPSPSPHNAHRITPACAGKSIWTSPTTTRTRDHPRVCGEKCPGRQPSSALWGSPPRVRGKVFFCAKSFPPFRITPACAGKSQAEACQR